MWCWVGDFSVGLSRRKASVVVVGYSCQPSGRRRRMDALQLLSLMSSLLLRSRPLFSHSLSSSLVKCYCCFRRCFGAVKQCHYSRYFRLRVRTRSGSRKLSATTSCERLSVFDGDGFRSIICGSASATTYDPPLDRPPSLPS